MYANPVGFSFKEFTADLTTEVAVFGLPVAEVNPGLDPDGSVPSQNSGSLSGTLNTVSIVAPSAADFSFFVFSSYPESVTAGNALDLTPGEVASVMCKVAIAAAEFEAVNSASVLAKISTFLPFDIPPLTSAVTGQLFGVLVTGGVVLDITSDYEIQVGVTQD